MVKAPKGYRHRTRKLLRKRVRERGAVPPLSLLMIDYRVGDKVHIDINPAIHKGMPHRRFQGKTGTVVGYRGRSLVVEVYLGDKKKILYTRQEHVKPTPEVWERVVSESKKLIEEVRSKIQEAKEIIARAK